jgi:hypothetical protein
MKTEEIEILQKNKIEKELKKEATSSCCDGAPTINEDACCKLDEGKKAEGESGFGCSTTAATIKSSCC